MECLVGNSSDRTSGCFTVLFSGRCGGRAAVASGCATGNNAPVGAHEWPKNRPAPVFMCLPVEICVAVVPNWS